MLMVTEVYDQVVHSNSCDEFSVYQFSNVSKFSRELEGRVIILQPMVLKLDGYLECNERT